MGDGNASKQLADLRAVLEVARRLGAATELDALLGLIVDAALGVLDAERASLFLYDAARRELVSKIAVDADEIRVGIDHGIAGAAASSGATVLVADAYADPRFNREVDRRTGWMTRNLLACPLTGFNGQLVGVLQVLNKRGGPFDQTDCKLAETLAAQAGVALERARLVSEQIVQARIARELQVAQAIQRRLLPQRAPRVAGFDIAGWTQPASETGGDYFDFVELPAGHCAVAVGDATGHGLGPALISTECRAVVRALLPLCPDIPSVLDQVNRVLCGDLGPGHFVTAFLGRLDPAAGSIDFASAGQGPILVARPSERTVTPVDSTGLPLGIDADAAFGPTAQIHLAAGDLLAVLTDGFFEWCNSQGEAFGIDRVAEALLHHAGCPAAELVQKLYRSVAAFAAGEPQADDLTAVIVQRSLR